MKALVKIMNHLFNYIIKIAIHNQILSKIQIRIFKMKILQITIILIMNIIQKKTLCNIKTIYQISFNTIRKIIINKKKVKIEDVTSITNT